MAIVTVPYQPYLTAEAAMEAFRRGFEGTRRTSSLIETSS
jgi:hypothetical protein